MQAMVDFLASNWLNLLLTMGIAYLLGSISFAIIVTKLFSHEDIRNTGSGNAGATNVLRSQGKLPALLTTLGDLGKSLASVLIGGWLMTRGLDGFRSYPNPESYRLIGQYLAGLFCIIGHLHPVFFGFRGGKGVLTTLGMMLILDWRVALISLGVFIVVVLFTRMVSLGSIVAAAVMAVLTYVFRMFVDRQQPQTVWFCTCMAVLIAGILIYKHRTNIGRILKGTESKLSFGGKK